MAWTLADNENRAARRTQKARLGTRYLRLYHVPPGVEADLPAEGDDMPGQSQTVLGPFIEADGISFGQQKAGANLDVSLRCLLLAVRSGGMSSSTYKDLELSVVGHEPDRTLYQTVGVSLSATDSTAPQRGSVLTGTGLAFDPVCVGVKVDENRFPGRYAYIATWAVPRLRSEQ